jgi:spore coat protein A, manganese oxidase
MKMSRRGFLAVAGGTGAALTLTNCGSAAKPA